MAIAHLTVPQAGEKLEPEGQFVSYFVTLHEIGRADWRSPHSSFFFLLHKNIQENVFDSDSNVEKDV